MRWRDTEDAEARHPEQEEADCGPCLQGVKDDNNDDDGNDDDGDDDDNDDGDGDDDDSDNYDDDYKKMLTC